MALVFENLLKSSENNKKLRQFVRNGLIERRQLADPFVQGVITGSILVSGVQFQHLIHLVNTSLDSAKDEKEGRREEISVTAKNINLNYF